MRISELSARTGIAVPTIKYYTREGLLPAGREVGYNRTEYDAGHESRLRLVRALLDVGGISIAQAREVIAAMEDTELGGFETAAAAQHAMSRPSISPSKSALDTVWRVLQDKG